MNQDTDTQISRLGTNWEELPINRPVCPVFNFNWDGQMRHQVTQGTVNYWPNRFEAVPPAKPGEGGFSSYPQQTISTKKRGLSDKFCEQHNQAQLFYNSMSPAEKFHIKKAFSFELDYCDDHTVYECLAGHRLAEIDLELAQTVAEMVGASVPDKQLRQNHGEKAFHLSHTDFMPQKPTIASRPIAIIIGDGYDPAAFTAIKTAVQTAGAIPSIIGTRRSAIYAEGENKINSKGVVPYHQYDGQYPCSLLSAYSRDIT